MPLCGIKKKENKKLEKIARINTGLHDKIFKKRPSDELDVIVNQNKTTKELCLDQNQEFEEQSDDESEEHSGCITEELNEDQMAKEHSVDHNQEIEKEMDFDSAEQLNQNQKYEEQEEHKLKQY